jgi:hypothetical protein
MTKDQLIDHLAELARGRTRSRSAVWWNGELIPVEEAISRASDLEEGDDIHVLHGEIIINAQLQSPSMPA